MSNELILIVEDEMITAGDLKSNLEDLGYIITGTARTAEQAIQDLEKLHADLILMDITLAGKMDGIEGASIIKDRFDIPVIYVTASADDATMLQAKATEPFGYIIKPYEKRELYIAVEIAIYKHRLERKLRQSEHKFRSLVELAYDGILIVSGGVIKYANPSFLEICGEMDEVVTNTPLHEYIHPDEIRKEAIRGIKKQSGEKLTPIYETVLKTKSGDYVDVEVSENEIMFEENKAELIIIRDISNRKPRN